MAPRSPGVAGLASSFPGPAALREPETCRKTSGTGGRLADIAPTVLHLMGLPKPAEMTGESLIVS